MLFIFFYFNFNQEWLCIIHYNFSDIIIMLLKMYFLGLSRIEVLVWVIFAFFLLPNL